MTPILYLYWLIALLHLAGVAIGVSTLSFFTKPFLMPVLIAWYFLVTRQNRTSAHWLMMIAFAFACAGDVFLMYTTELYFLLGLVSFLITHVLYIISFNKEIKTKGGALLLRMKPYLALPVVALAAGLVALVFNSIQPDMKIPVIVYSTVITGMVIVALNRYGKVSAASFRLVTIGVILFLFSDSLIALNKFYFNGQLWKASFFIMLLYITGQYLIARGTAKTD